MLLDFMTIIIFVKENNLSGSLQRYFSFLILFPLPSGRILSSRKFSATFSVYEKYVNLLMSLLFRMHHNVATEVNQYLALGFKDTCRQNTAAKDMKLDTQFISVM